MAYCEYLINVTHYWFLYIIMNTKWYIILIIGNGFSHFHYVLLLYPITIVGAENQNDMTARWPPSRTMGSSLPTSPVFGMYVPLACPLPEAAPRIEPWNRHVVLRFCVLGTYWTQWRPLVWETEASKGIQAYLLLLDFTLASFEGIMGFCFCFYKLNVCGNSASTKSTVPFSSSICSRHCLCVTIWQFWQQW